MISYIVIPLLWACPSLHIPVIGKIGASLIEKSPSKPILCTPSPGTPLRFDSLNEAIFKIKDLGPGASLSICNPSMECTPQEISWENIPSLKTIKGER